MSNYSIIEYFGGGNDGKCGYCKQEGNYNSHGFWAHTMSVEDYQKLINRNWRRSGQYIYLPQNSHTCCPMYTIKCDALNFKLSRSHKKILKNVNKFLKNGVKDKDRSKNKDKATTANDSELSKKPSKDIGDINIQQPIDVVASSNSKPQAMKSELLTIAPQDNRNEVRQISFNKKALKPSKRKYVRVEKKKAKLLAKGLTINDFKRRYENKEKTLEDFLGEEPKDGRHKLEVKLVQSREGSSDSILELFQKYQVKIHDDPPDKNSKRSYERFLVNSPLQFRKDSGSPPEGFGSFHYQYLLDGELIAVGVIDILPECVSSVYFFYNPEYSFLTLGTYASLREIALTRELYKSCRSLSSYYLGFYIPTCPKMRYKANVQPSYLLCPECFTWHLLDEKLSKEIDSVNYMRINKSGIDRDAFKPEFLNEVRCLFDRTAVKYGDLRKLTKSKKRNDEEEVLEYASKVGKSLSQSMLLYRS